MMKGSKPILIWGFLCGLIVLNVLQAAFTELDPDEAYYWMYSRELAWGYFDHPAGIALLIKTGYALLPNTLGVRLFSVLIMAGTFYLLWQILDRPANQRKVLLLTSLFLAMPMLQVYGFIATPDAPLLFFSALFLYAYQQFLDRNTWAWALLLGLCMAALLHSKYHGVLLIGFVFLSNWRLVFNIKWWGAALVGLLLFFPHLYWQWQQDFPSFRYHLSGRDDAYQLKYTLTYLLNQLVIFSPFLFPFIILALRRYQAREVFERSWKYLALGFWGLFLILTAKGHAEPHWTAILSLVFVLLLYRYAEIRPKAEKWLLRLSWATLLVLLLGRIILLLPLKGVDSEFHKRAWIPVLEEKAGNLPILFIDSYRDPSKFSFYSDKPAYGLTDVYYRKNQFDLWDWEKDLQNRQVFIVTQGDLDCSGCQPLDLPNRGSKKYVVADSFQVCQNVWIDFSVEKDTIGVGESVEVKIKLYNPYTHTIYPERGSLPLSLVGILRHAESEHLEWYPLSGRVEPWQPGENTLTTIRLTLPNWTKMHAESDLFIGIRRGELYPAFNSAPQRIFVSTSPNDQSK